MLTPVMKQYMKQIYLLADSKDEVIPSKVAKVLGVSSSAVSRMARKLADRSLITYEHYGKLYLTSDGKHLGKMLIKHHEVLKQFIGVVGVNDESEVKELEEIEYYMTTNLISRIEMLNHYFAEDKTRLQALYDINRR